MEFRLLLGDGSFARPVDGYFGAELLLVEILLGFETVRLEFKAVLHG